MNRRDFIKGVAAVSAVVVVPILATSKEPEALKPEGWTDDDEINYQEWASKRKTELGNTPSCEARLLQEGINACENERLLI